MGKGVLGFEYWMQSGSEEGAYLSDSNRSSLFVLVTDTSSSPLALNSVAPLLPTSASMAPQTPPTGRGIGRRSEGLRRAMSVEWRSTRRDKGSGLKWKRGRGILDTRIYDGN